MLEYFQKGAPKEIVEDREFVLSVAKLNGLAVVGSDYSPFRNDRDIMLEAMKNNGYALNFASDELKNDADLVMEALKCHGFVLKYSDELLQQRMEHCYFGAYLGTP
ncbi:hypothetical protein FDP41_006037 [Naegleria fowleri]|uniref:DUF4116 domain-containing protein n=1 Tax=Naegleria fowleri TaxID=5763 RepID=A0A6A5BJ86_NAEFO|nr:uncharacterized protein FDP41_006037 [Naegleria fowleri]KAF0974932.1 hypothetical protein FDP41_006037 [Naegleria fowleri]